MIAGQTSQVSGLTSGQAGEPFGRRRRPIGMDEFAEDLDLPSLPDWVEEYFARERAWHRLLRNTGLVTSADQWELDHR